MIRKAITVGFLTPVFLWLLGVAVGAQTADRAITGSQPQNEATTDSQSQGGTQNLTAGGENFKIQPFHFGLGTLVTWTRDAGEPDNLEPGFPQAAEGDASTPDQQGDPQQYGLYLQKNTATDNLAAAGGEITEITPMPAADLQVLAFDLPGAPGEPFGVATGYCSTGAPRFTVESESTNPCFLGCSHGTSTQDPTTGWWEIRFEPPFSQYPGCEGNVTGTVESISITFDEGNDLGPGNVILDNLRVNDKVVGKPTEGSDQNVNTTTQNATSVNNTSVSRMSANNTSTGDERQ